MHDRKGMFWCLIWLTQILERSQLEMRGGGGREGGGCEEGCMSEWGRGSYLHVMYVRVNVMMMGEREVGESPWALQSGAPPAPPENLIRKPAGG